MALVQDKGTVTGRTDDLSGCPLPAANPQAHPAAKPGIRITIVMVLHDINQSLYYSDEIVAMKDGKIIAHGLPEEIITGELVKEVYDVDLNIQSVDGKPFVIPV
ncbi:MAG: hypothetical protein ACLSB9_33750 [Hydrogeniiclostridium mannosilyticum]